jgi:hypothetical protein
MDRTSIRRLLLFSWKTICEFNINGTGRKRERERGGGSSVTTPPPSRRYYVLSYCYIMVNSNLTGRIDHQIAAWEHEIPSAKPPPSSDRTLVVIHCTNMSPTLHDTTRQKIEMILFPKLVSCHAVAVCIAYALYLVSIFLSCRVQFVKAFIHCTRHGTTRHDTTKNRNESVSKKSCRVVPLRYV